VNVFESDWAAPQNSDDEDSLSCVGWDSAPNNELQPIVDFMERSTYDNDPNDAFDYDDDWINGEE
jgi:hypothetical protein